MLNLFVDTRHYRVKKNFDYNNSFSDRLQICVLILSEFKRINLLLFPLKSSENLRFQGEQKLINSLKFIRLILETKFEDDP